ncbi:glycosyltransferase [Streptomyces caniscabiei]|uniref:glycosyltransferase n=1 Tax=Streptomyces caniscabiei TaxID=2746961 RepID=UPI0029A8353A|nr:glycosyltransferase [Streptomyces caniscabiei]MDX2776413.1 glycosyltransferase [Streptomyces caniscabiei]
MTKIRVLQFSSHDEDCGVGKYQEQFVKILQKEKGEIETKFFDSSPYKTRIMSPSELDEVMARLAKELASYDILHIQHEFGLYSSDEFKRLVDTAKELGKKVIVTAHTSPDFAFQYTRPGGVSLRSVLHVVRQKRRHEAFKVNHIEPMKRADAIIVHNQSTRNSLLRYGIAEDKIVMFTHPVPDHTNPLVSTEIATHLNKQPGDIIYATVGFLHRYKGIADAIKALNYLPSNYKLAIIGGMHPTSDEVSFYNDITDLINEQGLRDRVYITGFIKDDDRLNSLLRETDVCVYAYDRVYYASVSSGSLNLAFSNEKPVVAYPTDSFKEMNTDGQIVLTQTFAYYELARSLKALNVAKQTETVKKYAKKMSWTNATKELVTIYEKVV